MWTLCPHFVHIPAKANIMNRTDLIKAATADIDLADAPGSNYNYQSMHYLGAIAKLLLAEALDAPASPSRITDDIEWLPGDPV